MAVVCFPPTALFCYLLSLSLAIYIRVCVCVLVHIAVDRYLYIWRKKSNVYYTPFALLWRHCLLGTQYAPNRAYYEVSEGSPARLLELCHRCIHCLHIISPLPPSPPFSFLTINSIYTLTACQQVHEHCSPSLSKTGNIPTSGQAIIFPTACLFVSAVLG